MPGYADGFWSHDDLRLHYRDYPGGADGRPPVLCFPGLTRNARDFAALAERLSPAWRVIAVDFRGRGESAYSRDPSSYGPATYAEDATALIRRLDLPSFVVIGTSLGGLVALTIAQAQRGRLQGLVLNDVGPELEPAGVARIRSFVGRTTGWPTWLHAARTLADNNRLAYPDYRIQDWLAMAKRIYRLSPNGRIVIDYDARIADALRAPPSQATPDLWPTLDHLKDVPTLIVRGELSDMLSHATVDRMRAVLPQADSVIVPRVGHAPSLEELEAAAAIDRLLSKVR